MEAREKLLFKTNFPAELWGGQVIDKRYKILKFLNKGHRSYIYLAQNEIEEKPVVIRIIYHSALSFYIQRVINEAKKTIRQNLYHPNILQITDVGLAKLGDDNYCFIIQEFIELQTLMEIQSKITTELAVGVILTLCEVLDYLHKQNIIYGKLKSNSVLLANDGELKLKDIGIGRPRLFSRTNMLPKFTTDYIINILAYRAPEQLIGIIEPDELCDIYSIGIYIYEILSGYNPFSEVKTIEDLLYQKHHNIDSALNELKVEPLLRDIIAKAANLTPDNRYPNMKALINDLERLPFSKEFEKIF